MRHRDLTVRVEREMSLFGQGLQLGGDLISAHRKVRGKVCHRRNLAASEAGIDSDAYVFGVHAFRLRTDRSSAEADVLEAGSAHVRRVNSTWLSGVVWWS
ncbi:hypothetical protein GCM10027270_04530 [Nocardioides ginkgobilobae]